MAMRLYLLLLLSLLGVAAVFSSSDVCEAPEPSPTVKPANHLKASRAAKKLRKALKGWFSTDEDTVIDILTTHSNEQRQKIITAFDDKYGRDLKTDLVIKLTGDFENVVIAMMDTPALFDAKECYRAIWRPGTDDKTLIEILASRTNAQLSDLKEQYERKYSKDLDEAIRDDTSGHYRSLLLDLLKGDREEATEVNATLAKNDADKLSKAASGSDDDGDEDFDAGTFRKILSKRSLCQLRATFDEYKDSAGEDIEDTIKDKAHGDLKRAMLAVVRVAKNTPDYFAERLYKSMHGVGTADRNLIRVVVSRSEIDMGDIKKAFDDKYDKSLEEFIKSDTSGYYEKTLLALIGE